MKEEWNTIDAFMADNLTQFQPYAYYDKHMDCIRVKILNCSVTETRMSKMFTLLKSNGDSALAGSHVGFTIKGVAHLFASLGLSLNGVHNVANILNEIVKKMPHSVVKKVAEEFVPVVKRKNLTVDFDGQLERKAA